MLSDEATHTNFIVWCDLPGAWTHESRGEHANYYTTNVVDTCIDEIMYIFLQWISREGSKYITVY